MSLNCILTGQTNSVKPGNYGAFLNGFCWMANNSGQKSTTATLELTAKKSGYFRFSYACGGEKNYDYLKVTIDGTEVVSTKDNTGFSGGYYDGYQQIVVGSVIKFEHIEDGSNFNAGDYAGFSHMSLSAKDTTNSAVDMITPNNIEDYFSVKEGDYTFKPKIVFTSNTIVVNEDGKITDINNTSPNIYSLEDWNNTMTFDWGNEGNIGDPIWWSRLNTWVLNATPAERQACVGKKKKVSLSLTVSGANAASMICIGADQDGPGTLTFQTEGTLPNTLRYGSGSDIDWNGSGVRATCSSFGIYCSASDSIKSVTKLTSSATNGRRNNTADVVTVDKCWLPSEQEMGLDQYAPSRLECTQGTTNFGYSYYNRSERRIKYTMNSNGDLTSYTGKYWTRSKHYKGSNLRTAVGTNGKPYSADWSVNGDDTYLAPAFVIGVDNKSFDWGDEEAIGNETWWTELKEWVVNTTPDKRRACVGKKKKVSLDTPIIASINVISMICIDADKDGVGTLTFQAENSCAAQYFGGDTSWETSQVRQSCIFFGDHCSASTAIKPVIKLTSTANNDARDNTADMLTVDKAWLPSEQEMGLNEYSPSRQEQTKNTTNTGYSYYTNNEKRKKNRTNNDGTIDKTTFDSYWIRSRYYKTSNPEFLCYVSSSGISSGDIRNLNLALAPAFVIGEGGEPYDWGDESTVGDQFWWSRLNNWAVTTTPEQRAMCVGKKKKVSLSQPILGANAASMICIGADQDGPGTLTFQTEGVLPTHTLFGNSALWNESKARTYCSNFGDYCSASTAIKLVTKLTSNNVNNGRNNSASVSTRDKAWLPSEQEMGLDQYAPSRLECTQGTTNTGYSYYTSGQRRIKYQMDANGNVTSSTKIYWVRSRYYQVDYSDCVCTIDASGTPNWHIDTTGHFIAPAFVIGGQIVFNWGNENDIGNETWWSELNNWVINDSTPEQRAQCVGKKKKVSLSQPVLGANVASMICIGADQDGVTTLTFQTEGVLPEGTSFGTNALWSSSNVYDYCHDFGDYCSASAVIEDVPKLTSSICNNNRNNEADVITNLKCWLPSEQEMGIDSYSPSHSEHTQNWYQTGYSYYKISSYNRTKWRMDINGNPIHSMTPDNYWLRSRDTTRTQYVCCISNSGTADSDPYDSKRFLAPAFVIGAMTEVATPGPEPIMPAIN